MKKLGVYRPEYDQLIAVYSGLLEQYERLRKETTDRTLIERKNSVVTIENLRRDIAKYSDLLCLNPRTFEKTTIKEPQKKSKLESALEMISNG